MCFPGAGPEQPPLRRDLCGLPWSGPCQDTGCPEASLSWRQIWPVLLTGFYAALPATALLCGIVAVFLEITLHPGQVPCEVIAECHLEGLSRRCLR